MQQNISFQVNNSRLLQNHKMAFSNHFTVLSELMQNARRAKATYVAFDLDGDTLTVTDNGSGIDDFQNLLTLAESGWDAKLAEQESAYQISP